jgi:hypothetical protein
MGRGRGRRRMLVGGGPMELMSTDRLLSIRRLFALGRSSSLMLVLVLRMAHDRGRLCVVFVLVVALVVPVKQGPRRRDTRYRSSEWVVLAASRVLGLSTRLTVWEEENVKRGWRRQGRPARRPALSRGRGAGRDGGLTARRGRPRGRRRRRVLVQREGERRPAERRRGRR